MSIRKACAVLGVSRSYYAYKPHPRDDSEVVTALIELAEKKPARGFSKLFTRLRNMGHPWDHKRVWRVYCLLKMNLKRKAKKRLPQRARKALAQPLSANFCWSIDFMRDTLYSGRTFRTFNAVDDYNREVLAVEVNTRKISEWIMAQNLSAQSWPPGLNSTALNYNSSNRESQHRTHILSVLTVHIVRKSWISISSIA